MHKSTVLSVPGQSSVLVKKQLSPILKEHDIKAAFSTILSLKSFIRDLVSLNATQESSHIKEEEKQLQSGDKS